MANVFLTADTHFGHANIIAYANRPFRDVTEMDEALIERWNAVVRPQDRVYHLGDVAMPRRSLALVRRLNGHKRLIMGNHDIFDGRDYLNAGFEKILGMRVLDELLLTHLPVHAASVERFGVNVHGHTHEAGSPPGPYLSVCVELTEYRPLSLDEVRDRAKHRRAIVRHPFDRELCRQCGGNGVLAIKGGVAVCDRCEGFSLEPVTV